MILNMIATGRQAKEPPKENKVTLGGVQCLVTEADYWEGPCHAGESGQYYRGTFVELVGKVRDDRFPLPRTGEAP